MDIYFVQSELIEHIEWEDWTVGAGHHEDYCIAMFVRAGSHGQAKYLAWRNDDSFSPGDIRDMPQMSARKIMADVDGEPGVISWDDPLINELESALGAAIASDAKYKRRLDELAGVIPAGV